MQWARRKGWRERYMNSTISHSAQILSSLFINSLTAIRSKTVLSDNIKEDQNMKVSDILKEMN
jgi:hypothetical protein